MRFSVITVAAAVCLIAGVQAAPAGAPGAEGAGAGAGASPAPGGGALDVTKTAGGLGTVTGAASGLTSGAGGAGGVGKVASGVVPGAPAVPGLKRSPAPPAGAPEAASANPQEEAGTVQRTTEPVSKLADTTADKVTGSANGKGGVKAGAPLKATVNGIKGSTLGDQKNKGVAGSVAGGL